MRFWGKIRGTNKDYYILEGTLDKVEEVEGDEGAAQTEVAEARGVGINKFVYWATNGPCLAWT